MAEKDINITDELNELKKKGLLSKQVVIIKGPIHHHTPSLQQQQESTIDEEGLKEISVAEMNYAPACHHVIHSKEEIGSVCTICHQLMCKACSANNICQSCGKAVCRDDQKYIEEVGVVCSQCKKDWFVKKLISFLITAGLLGIVIFFLLRFFP